MIWKDQSNYINKIEKNNKFGIFLDMGVGKTALLLGLIDVKLFQDVKKVLILTPKAVSISTWQDEIKKWKNFNYMSKIINLLDGTLDKRNKIIKDVGEFCIHIMSYDLLANWLLGTKEAKETKSGKTYKKFKHNAFLPKYDMVIVDECSGFKNPSSRRFKALKQMHPNYLYLLSGTPFSNIKKETVRGKTYYMNATELYYILYLLDIYKDTYTNFKDDFCTTFSWDNYNFYMAEDTYKYLLSKIDEKSIKEELVIDVKLIEQKIYCELDIKRFGDMKDDYFFETNDLMNITASNRAIMINKCLQLSNGFIYQNEKVFRINDYKLNRLKELLQEIKGNTIIFYLFKEDKEYLLSNIKDLVLYTGEPEKNDWNAGKIKYLLLSPFSQKFGLNLQFGGNNIIWFGLIWSGESYIQSIRRIYRKGQSKDVNIYYLLSRKSFDDYVYDTVVKKTRTIKDFITAIKEP